MSTISSIGRRSGSIRMLIIFIYTVLTIGSITMIYPFVIMLSTSITNDVDFEDYTLIPRYIHDDTQLMRKYLYDKYGNYGFPELKSKYQLGETYNYRELKEKDLPKFDITSKEFQTRVTGWFNFLKTLPPDAIGVFFFHQGEISKLSTQEFIARYQGYLKKKYDNDIKRYNQVAGTSYEYFEEILPAQVEYTHVSFPPEIQEDTGVARIYSPWGEYKKTLHPGYIRSYSLDMVYQKFMNERFEGDIARYNRAFGTAYKYFSQVEFPYAEPDTEDAKRSWVELFRKRLPLRIVELTGGDETYQRYLEEKYQTIEKYNAVYKETRKSFGEITLPRTIPAGAVKTIDWVRFVDDVLPKEYLRVNSTERLFQAFLKDIYNDNINNLNKAYGTDYRNFSEIKPFYKEADYYDFYTHYREIKNKFIFGNYATVIKFILMKNKAVTNTFILVLATVVTQLTIQPLAAYALSRFKLSYGHWILLFLLATMAFPAEVAMIPNFLLIKELRLLNTYWALILPGMASGMGIFLLKGFFDSLPMELYESASIDGASELRIFWNITLPLSKPILAVIALGAFGSAYGGFLWAFLICQVPSMWTIMVFLYQFQMKNTQSVVMASLVIAAIPTLLVFIFCQKIILRGIIIPTMK